MKFLQESAKRWETDKHPKFCDALNFYVIKDERLDRSWKEKKISSHVLSTLFKNKKYKFWSISVNQPSIEV